MTRLQDLSLKYKVPLRVAVLVIVTAVVLAATLIYRGIDDLRNNLIDNADKMGRVIANNLVEPMLHDDVWRSFEIINTPYRVPTLKTPDEKAGYILILNASNKVYASTQPDRFPMLKDPAAIDPRYTELLKALPDLRRFAPNCYRAAQLGRFVFADTDSIRADAYRHPGHELSQIAVHIALLPAG